MLAKMMVIDAVGVRAMWFGNGKTQGHPYAAWFARFAVWTALVYWTSRFGIGTCLQHARSNWDFEVYAPFQALLGLSAGVVNQCSDLAIAIFPLWYLWTTTRREEAPESWKGRLKWVAGRMAVYGILCVIVGPL